MKLSISLLRIYENFSVSNYFQTRLWISVGKSFNLSSAQSSGYVALGILLPRNCVRPAFRFHPTVRGNASDRWVTCRLGHNDFSCLAFLIPALRTQTPLWSLIFCFLLFLLFDGVSSIVVGVFWWFTGFIFISSVKIFT